MEISDCTGHLEGLQHASYIYGYLEAVVCGILIVLTILLSIFNVSKGDTPSSNVQNHMMEGCCRCLCCTTSVFVIIYLGVQIMFDVGLIKGLQHQNSAAVLSYFIFGVISNILRLAFVGCNFKEFKQSLNKCMLGVNITVIVFSVLYCGILWMVFQCYHQIKSDPHCLQHQGTFHH